MSEYTPTTVEVRRRYAHTRPAGNKNQSAVAEFDRWLAAHDAVVREEFATGKWELRYPCPHWNPQRITLRKGCTACLAVGIKKVPVEN